MKRFISLTITSLFASTLSFADVGDLLISEVAITPTAGEFIEIYNSGGTAVDLTNVYLTDATFAGGGTYYYQIVSGGGGGGGFADFHARFPNGAMINAGAYQTIALNGSTNFNATYGVNPTYELYEEVPASPDAIPDMLEAVTGSINGQGGLSNGEVAVLYSWDGTSDLVQDLDYVLWGDKVEAIDKSGVMVNLSTYQNDTPITNQAVISTSAHAGGMSWQRNESLNEGVEVQVGGNGINNSDETSEDLNNTFYENMPSPNAAGTPPPPPPPSIIINEVDAVGTSEFIEIKGTPGTSLNDVTLVLYQGSDDTNYHLLDLSAQSIPANGYLLISDAAGLTPDTGLGATLNDDASAVAIYFSNISNFAPGAAVTSTDIIDALVYDSGQADDAGLLTLLNAFEPQVNEDSNSALLTESNARCADGKGGALNTSSYMQVTPTAGEINNTCPILPYYASADPSTPVTLRTTLHEIIKGHTSYPYSSSSTDTWDILSYADEDHNTAVDVDNMAVENVWMVYKNNSYPYNGGGAQPYNREHTWPKSKGFTAPDNNAPRTDAHHLMMSDAGYNSTRGNKYYDNCNPNLDNTCVNASLQTTEYDGDGDGITEGGNTGSTYPGNSNWTNNTVFETWNFRKGDVARAMFYMDVRYEGLGEVDSSGTPEPDLVLTNDANLIQTTTSSPAYMGILSTLLEWHANDPVDDIELQRNEVVFSYQGNRNPFIDHPEWVACIFQNNCVPVIPTEIFKNGFE
jgi:endonuclease I